ncbi:hypothetical protein [Ligilactobacillus apodemi]|uniref:Polysaccharide polymerase n=1 Tax=Ligilactobacillus apodemi DSM 16634 = JCM 16172 TaxID=1423724 RepID=A0A0R1U2C3_9LACO|nr:hypothetical protein [Ligilactobacillus apodemi]KRL87472.1 hypothetical protein FC32_GL000034 [Ligilactobacillus apodemi DSM 16634 = JCM 16172]MCR1901946.1 hypothetical protein [Ligilactobacillus apodemi]
MLEKINWQRDNLGNYLYMYSLTLYLIVNFAAGTTLSKTLGLGTMVVLLRLSQLATLIVFLKIIFLDKHKFNTLLAFIAGAGFLLVACKQARELEPLFMFVFMVGAYNINFKEILDKYILVILTMFLLTYVATLIGLVPNNVIWRANGGPIRAGLGLSTSSDMAAHSFYLMLAYALVHNFSLKRQQIGFLGLIAVLIFALTNSRLDGILMALLLLCLYFRRQVFQFMRFIGKKGVTLFVVLYALGDLALTYCFDVNNRFYALLDTFLSHRLLFGKIAFEKYPLRFLGQYIYQNGNGDPRGYVKYYFIDSAFVQAWIMFGILFFIFMMCVLCFLIFKAYKHMYYGLILAVILIVISMAINHHFWNISYNVILLATLAKMPRYESD